MSTITLTYTPQESYSLIKEHRPNTWEANLYKYNCALYQIVGENNVTLTKALQHFINRHPKTASKIYALASYYHIMTQTNQKVKDYESVLSGIKNCEAQLKAIATSKSIQDQDRPTLTESTKKRLRELRAKEEAFINDPEFTAHIEVKAEVIYPD